MSFLRVNFSHLCWVIVEHTLTNLSLFKMIKILFRDAVAEIGYSLHLLPPCPHHFINLVTSVTLSHPWPWPWQEHRMEIDARGGTFQAFEMFGHQLLQNNHYASDDVREKLRELADAKEELEKWVTSFNSLAPGRSEWNYRQIILKPILVIDGWGISCEIALRCECHWTLLIIS